MAFGPVVLVVGMHRSGTSAVTRVLNLLGVRLGSNLLPAANDNTRGFWEHQDAVSINEQLLSALGRSWFDLRELPAGWQTTQAAMKARLKLKELFARDFSAPGAWAVKDPRICRLLPLWRSVLEELGVKVHVLFMVRHPHEVAQSLHARDGISEGQSCLAWAQHMAEAEVASRGLPRSVLLYDDLLTDWTDSMERIAGALGIRWPIDVAVVNAEVEDFLVPAARHHAVSEGCAVKLPRFVHEIYEALVSVAHGTKSWSAVSSLSDMYDEVAGSFLASLEVIAPRFDEDARSSMRALLGKLDAKLAALDDYIAMDRVIDDAAKLYFRKADQSHAEDRAVRANHDGLGKACRIKFELPVGEAIDFLRFDPSEFGGTFDIFELTLDDVVIDNIGCLVAAVNQNRLAPSTNGGVRISSGDNDPYVEFSLAAIEAPRAFRTCTVGVRRESLIERMRDACVAAMHATVSEVRASEMEKIEAAFDPLRQYLEDVRHRKAESDELRSEHRRQLAELMLNQRDAIRQLGSLGIQMETSKRQMAELNELQLGVQERDARHQLEMSSLRELVMAQSVDIASMGENTAASHGLMRKQLEALVDAQESTLRARWRRWLRKGAVD